MSATAPASILSDATLESFRSRAAAYDRENRFFDDDFADLRKSGYLLMPIPKELGGLGMNLAEVCREQRRLAEYAPATALATNMHLYWMGVAATLYQMGDTSCRWMLEEGAQGGVFAAGHAEAGNDLPALLSTARAERVDGGYKFYGHKNFGSLTPVWTRFGLHAMDTSDPAAPKVVHAFMARDTPGYTIKETWDTLGMRATRSDDTILEGAFVPDSNIPRVVPAGFAGVDLFVLGIFIWAMPTFGNIYLGIAKRAFEIALTSARTKTSIALGGKPMGFNPMVQYTVAEMAVELDAITAHLDRIADDWSNGVDLGGLLPAKLVAAKYHAVEGARRVAKLALDVVGGAGIFKANELERLLRDVTLGPVHPANSL
ncbi:MAG TPA: acyl-CoA dehydrogenase family protein, partial [Dehalococcoidia bacterium]|nr:acyl-CoA dehydrogenase family protein [Dehalococcoidia bacterium]